MELHSDFSRRVLVHADQLPWLPSPTGGVDRRMLDRIGGEVARATSIVRYSPGSAFPAHTHGGGEEFIVLEGVFQDEHGDYPAGTYVRNPPTSRHSPGSAPGCTIFVKLWQFDPADRTFVRADMTRLAAAEADDRPGVQVAPLYGDAREEVRMELWAPRTCVSFDAPDGAELLVLDGSCDEAGEAMHRHSWLRVPVGGRVDARAGAQGTRVWIKTGGLRSTDPPAA